MALFNITISESDYLVTKSTFETECSTMFTYTVEASAGDLINIVLSGSHIFETYTLNGVETSFVDTVVGIVFDTTLTFNFFIPNSGVSGTFLESEVIITNTSSSNSNKGQVDLAIRKNDDQNCDDKT